MQTLARWTAVALLISLVACTHRVYSANGTTVTTDDSNKSVTVTTKEGTATYGKDAVDLSKLGVPIYPGAKSGSNYSVSTPKGMMTALSSPDNFDKVYAWYKAQLPKDSEKMKVEQGDSAMAEFVTGEDGSAKTMVMLTGKKDETSIVITKELK